MKRTKNKGLDIQLGDSPLLSRNDDGMTIGQLQSTIHPERFDMSRFSEMQDKEDNPIKVIFYVVAVIIIGVVLALVVRQLISNSQNIESNESQNESFNDKTTQNDVSLVEINVTEKLDAEATERPSNDEYRDTSQVSAGNASAQIGDFALGSVTYNKYESFGRVEMRIDGLASISEFPALKFEFASDKKSLRINLPNGYVLNNAMVNELVSEASEIGDLLSNIKYLSANNSIELTFREEVLYRILPSVSRLIIDFKAVNQSKELENSANKDDDTKSTVQPSNPQTPTQPTTQTNPTSEVNYTNAFSKNDQYIKSKVTGNTIPFNNFYYEDTGSYFEFSWGVTNQANEDLIPNVSAKLIEESGVNYIEVKISNLASEPFALSGLANLGTDLGYTGINLSAANFVRVDRINFQNGVATYRVRLKYKSDFRIVADTTIGDPTPDQVINLQIRD